MTDPKDEIDFLTFIGEMIGGPTLEHSETAQRLVQPYQQQLIEQLADPQTRRFAIISGGRHNKSELTRMLTEYLKPSPQPEPGVIGTHPDTLMIIFDEVFALNALEDWPEDDMVWTGKRRLTLAAEPLTGKERERQHWTSLNGGSQPWKAKRGKRRK